MVPEGWKIARLGNLLEGSIKNGYSPLPAERETGYWVLGLGALSDSGLVRTEIKPVEPTDEVKSSLLREDDFLVSRSNTPNKVGRSIRFRGEVSNCSYPDLMMRFRVDPRIADLDFIEHKLKSRSVRQYLQRSAAGSSGSMVKINKATLETAPIEMPEIPEQRKIAKILSTWDEAITTTERLLANSEQQKKTLMQQLLTGKQRLPGFEGGWAKRKVGDLLKVRKEKRLPSENCPLYSLTIEDGVTPKTERYNREFLVRDSESKRYKLVEPSDIVYNPANLRWGAINYSRLSHSVVVSPIYEVLYVSDERKANVEFLAHALMSHDQINRFAAMVEGTLMERKAVKIEPFLATKIAVPPTVEEQRAVANVLSFSDSCIGAVKEELWQLKEEKKSLMQQLLTGKRRVKVDTEAVKPETATG